jgi:hypothetical protein
MFYTLSYRVLLVLVLCVVGASVMANNSVNKLFTVGCFAEKGTDYFSILNSMYKAVLEPMGYQVKFVSTLTVSGKKFSQNGKLDAVCAAFKVTGEDVRLKTMIMLPIAVAVTRFSVWSDRNIDHSVLSKAKVGFQDQVTFLHNDLNLMGINAKSYETADALLSAYETHEVDYVVMTETPLGFSKKHHDKVKALGLKPKFRILQMGAYPLLNKKHQGLMPEFMRRLEAVTARDDNMNPIELVSSDTGFTKTITFACSLKENGAGFHVLDKLYRGAFNALGFNFAMKYIPAARIDYELISGSIDGVCLRMTSKTVKPDYNLVAVNHIITSAPLQLWSHNIQEIMDEYVPIDQSVLAYVRGVKAAESFVEKHPNLKTLKANDADQLLKYIAGRRADYALDFDLSLMSSMNNIKLFDRLYYVGQIDEYKMRPYLAPEFAHLSQPMAEYLTQHKVNFPEQIFEEGSKMAVFYRQ